MEKIRKFQKLETHISVHYIIQIWVMLYNRVWNKKNILKSLPFWTKNYYSSINSNEKKTWTNISQLLQRATFFWIFLLLMYSFFNWQKFQIFFPLPYPHTYITLNQIPYCTYLFGKNVTKVTKRLNSRPMRQWPILWLVSMIRKNSSDE